MKIIFILIAVSTLGLSVKAQTIPSWKITDVVKYYNRQSDTIYVINFWATWCKPCVQELPYLQSITKKYADKKVKLLLVSLDFASFYPDKIKSFANKQHINADIVWLNETDADYFCNKVDTRWSGVIPATIIVNAAKNYRQFYEAELTESEFESAIKQAISQ